ncbi:hypothetical protein [Sphingomonas sp. MS122]
MTDRKDDTPPSTAKPAKLPARGRLDGAAPEPEAQDNTAKGRKGG